MVVARNLIDRIERVEYLLGVQPALVRQNLIDRIESRAYTPVHTRILLSSYESNR